MVSVVFTYKMPEGDVVDIRKGSLSADSLDDALIQIQHYCQERGYELLDVIALKRED